MDGMTGTLTRVVAELDREDGPAPWVTTDALAARAAALGPPGMRGEGERVPYAPEAALAACERQARRRALRRDSLERLYETGRVSDPERRAGAEIREVWRWRHGLGLPRVGSQLGEMVDEAPAEPYGEAWLGMLEADHLRFAPWSEWAGAVWVKRDRSRTLRDLTLLVVADGLGLRQASCELRLEQSRALARLREALAWYAHRAGWQGEAAPLRIGD